jgi:hypothetical protein
MSLNYFLHRHQVSLLRSRNAATIEGRISHHKLAELYAERVRAISVGLGGASFTVEKSVG